MNNAYQDNLKRIAEKFAIGYLEPRYRWGSITSSAKERRIKEMLPLAAIALEEMAGIAKHNVGDVYSDPNEEQVQNYLINLGLVPDKTTE